jgi:energy-coupling factor transporter ATP-binding protein EcfA2
MMMLEGANLLVFDEPTNHLDVESIEALKTRSRCLKGTVLIVSHDRALLRALTTRVWALENGRIEDFGVDSRTGGDESRSGGAAAGNRKRSGATAKQQAAGSVSHQHSVARTARRKRNRPRPGSPWKACRRVGGEALGLLHYTDPATALRAEELSRELGGYARRAGAGIRGVDPGG